MAQFAGLGLDAIAADITDIREHLHTHEYWFGKHSSYSAPTDCGDRDSLVAYQLTSGNDAYGSWGCVLGSNDTPINASFTKFGPHRGLYIDASQKGIVYKVQFAAGANAAACDAAALVNDVSEIIIIPTTTQTVSKPISIIESLKTSGIPYWARLWVNGADAQTLDFFLGVHEHTL